MLASLMVAASPIDFASVFASLSLESLLDEPVQGSIQPLPMALGCALLFVAAVSANTSAALLVFSPTKLEKLHPLEAQNALGFLRLHDLEARVLTRLLTLAAATGCILLTSDSVSGLLGRAVFIGICVLMVFLVVVLPAAIAKRRPENVVMRMLPWIRPLLIVLAIPVVIPLIRVSRPVLRAMKIPEGQAIDPDEIADDILAAVSDTAGSNELAEEEKAWIGNIVELKELHASEVMMPRTDIHALEASTPLAEAIRVAVEKGHSRFPVFKDTIDNVVGVFYAKDVLSRFAQAMDVASITVGELTRDALFAPESMRISDLLREFKTSKVQMAIVIDEYGGTAGLITIEDILEEIVGEIEDEFDPEEEAPITVIQRDQVIEVSGKTRVEEANDAIGADLVPEGEDYDTVAGFVFAHLGQIPEIGTTFQVAGLEFRILGVDNRRISRVRLTVLTTQPSDS
jgi:magnesium and cobalt exporter, CNNM family